MTAPTTPSRSGDTRSSDLATEWSQSLADGAPGIALPHIERARTGAGPWQPVHDLAVAMTREPVHARPDITNLFRGAPAVAYTLHLAGHPAYRTALDILDGHINPLVQARLDTAHQRIDAGHLPAAGEYDLINGLTGLGVYLLHRHGDHALLRHVLTYLVRLTAPVRAGGEMLPGWWATGSPDRHRSARWDGGHAGFGMAHGIAGPLALLSSAMLRGLTVTGHTDAIHAISAWYDQWQTGTASDPGWPDVIDRHEQRTAQHTRPGPSRPSWCYGTPGIANAHHLAGRATRDQHRTTIAEHALLGCLTDPQQLALITDPGLCHGWAGLAHTAYRTVAHTTNPALTTAANAATARFHDHPDDHGPPPDDGLMDGAAGITLTNITDSGPVTPGTPRWDACLLLS